MAGADPQDSIADLSDSSGGVSKLQPVLEPAARNHVIHSSQRPSRMIQVTMNHAIELYSF